MTRVILTSCRPAKRDLSQLSNQRLDTIAAGRSKPIRMHKADRVLTALLRGRPDLAAKLGRNT